ncbi:MAG: hypothetical protein QXX79_03510 [Candidatus Bathyarchaeia archaeon]
MTEEKTQRRPFLTARQVGMVAAFGGMGFAWRALGLVIPLYPPFVLDIRETVIILAAFAGGPYVGIVSGFLMGLPSAIPLMDIWYYPGIALTVCAVTKRAWKFIQNGKSALGYGLLIVTIIFAEAFWGTLANLFISEYGLGLVSFWPEQVAFFMGGTYEIYVLQEIIPLLICLKLFPSFMEPKWLWSGGEAVE